VPDRGRAVLEGIRYAADLVSGPSGVVAAWKAATGGKAVGCLPPIPVPELLHAAGLLPIAPDSPEDLSPVAGQVDAWLIGGDTVPVPGTKDGAPRFSFPRVPPRSLEEALDRVESLAEWATAVSGSPASEGGIWKSIRAYAVRGALLDALAGRCARETAFLSPRERRDILRAGNFLSPESHSFLLRSILGGDPCPGGLPAEGERGDPLLVLAKRLK